MLSVAWQQLSLFLFTEIYFFFLIGMTSAEKGKEEHSYF